MPLTLEQKLTIAGLCVGILAAIAAWIVVPVRRKIKGIIVFIRRWLTRSAPRAEDYSGIKTSDRKTLEDILATLPSQTISWIRNQNFGDGFWDRNLDPIYEFNWKHSGPEHEFLDKRLEELRIVMTQEIQTFMGLVARYSTARDGWRKIPNQYVSGEWTPECDDKFFKMSKEINDSADRVCDSYNSLIRRARLYLALSE